MLRKMILLASVAMAAAALAAPAPASALEWTDEEAAYEGTATDTLSGMFYFGNPEPASTRFGCVIHAGMSLTGEFTTASVSSLEPTTSECEGAGSFAGCQLSKHSTTRLPAELRIRTTDTLTFTSQTLLPIEIHHTYDGLCPIEKVTLTVFDFMLEGSGSDLTDMTISGSALAHTWIRNVGEITQVVAVWGTMGTETDTMSID